MAFDSTYLTKTLGQMRVKGEASMVGGVWHPDQPGNACLSIQEGLDIKAVPKAASMLEMVAWQPCMKHRAALSVCSVPVETNFKGPHASIRSQAYMLQAIGLAAEAANGLLEGLIFDAHGSHQAVRRLLHGDTSVLPEDQLSQIPFFRDLTYRDLPCCCIPNLPIKIAIYQNQPVHGMPGICALDVCE